jgi:1-acyl-sn-glycerol-3-phosphate acyltransferase
MSDEAGAYSPTTGASGHGANLRHHLWRLVYGSTGGLTVTGPLPSGPAVLVANHSSHADTAALLAAVPAAGRPVFAAAADYWFATPVRRFLITTLAAAVPVQRHADGAYAALLEACEPVVASGGIVIVYPEGTRSTDGSVGRFASGGARLAADLGVGLVPVALLGTRDVLAKHGTFQAAPVEVRFGAAEPAGDREAASERSAALRERVAGLLGSAPMADPRSPVGVRVERFVDVPGGLAAGSRGGSPRR